MTTLKEAKDFLRKNFDEGADCPCCGQFVKLYKRKITSSMAQGLIVISKRNEVGEYFHLLTFFKNIKFTQAGIAGDLSKLRWWGLLEMQEGTREDGNPNTGYYCLTKNGKLFVGGLLKVKKYVFIYNNVVRSKSDEFTDIKECLGDKFNYDDLIWDSYE